MTSAALGVAGAWVGYAWLPHLLTPASVWRGPSAARRIALTFDDGPDPEWTPRILETLERREVRATFFVVGERAQRAPALVRAIERGGHEIGNHSWSHPNLWFCTPSRTAAEIDRTQELLADLTGTTPRYFRPPWGIVNLPMFALLRRRGLECVFWSIQPEGLRSASSEAQTREVLSRAYPGAIVDLHDAEGVANAPARLHDALPAMIDGLRDAGYELTTVTGLLATTA